MPPRTRLAILKALKCVRAAKQIPASATKRHLVQSRHSSGADRLLMVIYPNNGKIKTARQRPVTHERQAILDDLADAITNEFPGWLIMLKPSFFRVTFYFSAQVDVKFSSERGEAQSFISKVGASSIDSSLCSPLLEGTMIAFLSAVTEKVLRAQALWLASADASTVNTCAINLRNRELLF